jgi:hypothetical protein
MRIIVCELFSVNQINQQYFYFSVKLLSWINYKNATFSAYYEYMQYVLYLFRVHTFVKVITLVKNL